ncbi:MAG TPA: hypothetical protein VHB21_04905 [Minicystis sp.]|nr:hypothetical protein [Minicystis sp.]
MIRSARVAALALGVAAGGLGCGAGPYGHARTYVPLDAEEKAVAGAPELDPVMARRMPDQWVKKKVALFGVVLRRKDAGGGRAEVVLSLRALEPRNLCANTSDDSCRVTVSDRAFDRVLAKLRLATHEDAAGPTSIGFGSLLRVVGTLEEQPGPDGALVVDATYYRHWPRGDYVTTRSAPFMRQ